jgi:hypothetical protein
LILGELFGDFWEWLRWEGFGYFGWREVMEEREGEGRGWGWGWGFRVSVFAKFRDKETERELSVLSS